MSTIQEILGDKYLIKEDGSHISGYQALSGKRKVLVYFSAHWCPPCRGFTPMLKHHYEDYLYENDIEIVFVSSDSTADNAKRYFDQMGGWLMTAHNSEESRALKQLCNVRGIPHLAMFGRDGNLIGGSVRNYIASDDRDFILKDE